MTMETLPRPLGNYLLTAALGEDALGHEYRAMRTAEGGAFVRLRVLDAPELSEDARPRRHRAERRGPRVPEEPGRRARRRHGRRRRRALHRVERGQRPHPQEPAGQVPQPAAQDSRGARPPDCREDRDGPGPRIQHEHRRRSDAPWAGVAGPHRDLRRRRDSPGRIRPGSRSPADSGPAAADTGGRELPRAGGAGPAIHRKQLRRLLGRRDPSRAADRPAAGDGSPGRSARHRGQPASADPAGDPGRPAHDAGRSRDAVRLQRRLAAGARQALVFGSLLPLDVQPRLLPERPLQGRDRGGDSRTQSRVFAGRAPGGARLDGEPTPAATPASRRARRPGARTAAAASRCPRAPPGVAVDRAGAGLGADRGRLSADAAGARASPFSARRRGGHLLPRLRRFCPSCW